MSTLKNIQPEYVYVTVPSEYICLYHAILTMMADFGEEMLLDCKASCKTKNHNVIDCFNMFNSAIAARALNKTKLEQTLIKYIKSQIKQIYKNSDKEITFKCSLEGTSYIEAYAIKENSTVFKIDLASINSPNKYVKDISEWTIVTNPSASPNIVNQEGDSIILLGKVKRNITYGWSDERPDEIEIEELDLKWKVSIDDDDFINISGSSYHIQNSSVDKKFIFVGYTDSPLGFNYTSSNILVNQVIDTPEPLTQAIYGCVNFEQTPDDLKESIKDNIESTNVDFNKINQVLQHTDDHNNIYSVILSKGNKNACAFFLLPVIPKYENKKIIHCSGIFGDETITNAGGIKNIDGSLVNIDNIDYKLYAFLTNVYYDDIIFNFGLI